jgi:hypothetical protein
MCTFLIDEVSADSAIIRRLYARRRSAVGVRSNNRAAAAMAAASAQTDTALVGVSGQHDMTHVLI